MGRARGRGLARGRPGCGGRRHQTRAQHRRSRRNRRHRHRPRPRDFHGPGGVAGNLCPGARAVRPRHTGRPRRADGQLRQHRGNADRLCDAARPRKARSCRRGPADELASFEPLCLGAGPADLPHPERHVAGVGRRTARSTRGARSRRCSPTTMPASRPGTSPTITARPKISSASSAAASPPSAARPRSAKSRPSPNGCRRPGR